MYDHNNGCPEGDAFQIPLLDKMPLVKDLQKTWLLRQLPPE